MNQSQLKFETKGRGQHIVFSHGTPTYSGEYESVVAKLQDQYCCVLIDHLGFGNSPQPRDGNYAIEAHQQRFKEALVSNDIQSFHLVVHDFGAAIALPLLFDSDFKILSLTILNSWYWPLIETEPQMRSQKLLVQIGILPFLYRYFNLSAKVLLKMAWGTHRPLTQSRHEHYISKFPTPNERSGTIAFLKVLFDFDHSVWKKTDSLKTIKVPTQLIWGKADKLISTRNLVKWKSLLPQAKVTLIEEAGHFVAEEAPQIVADELCSFLERLK